MKTTLPAIAWTVLVLAFSTDLFSGMHTGSVIASMLPMLRPDAVDAVNFVIRKSAHLVEYAVLSFLWFRALRGESPSRWALRWAVLAVVIAAGVASIDEWHQSFVPSRTSSPWDVALDGAGATLAQVVVLFRSARDEPQR